MKQIVQYFNNGETVLLEVPVPNINEYQILIKTSLSLISSGTEKMLIEFGKGNLLQKVKQQPEKVKTVLQKSNHLVYQMVEDKPHPYPPIYHLVDIVILHETNLKNQQHFLLQMVFHL